MSHPGSGMNRAEVGGESAIRANPRMRVTLFVIGFGSYLNLNAVQPVLLLYQLFRASEVRMSLTASASALAIAYVSEEASAEAVGRTMAAYVTGSITGGFSGRFLNGLVAPYWGWRAAFVILGAATFLGAAGTGWRLPPSTRSAPQCARGASYGVQGKHLWNNDLLATYVIGASLLLSLISTVTYVNFYPADPPFGLGSTWLSMLFGVYLLAAAVTPVAGRLVDRLGDRRALIGAVRVPALGMLITLLPVLIAVVAGLTFLAAGVFACQAAAQSHVGTAGREAPSAAAGLYISLFYLGGALGSVIPGLFWSLAGWPGCGVFVLVVQLLTAGIISRYWARFAGKPCLPPAGAGEV